MAKAKKRTPKKIVNNKLVDADDPVDDYEDLDIEPLEDLNIIEQVAEFDEIEGDATEEEYILSENAEELLDAIAEEATEEIGVPTLLRHPAPQSNEYPTENHSYTRTKFRPGDIAPQHNQTLIIRADPPKEKRGR